MTPHSLILENGKAAWVPAAFGADRAAREPSRIFVRLGPTGECHG